MESSLRPVIQDVYSQRVLDFLDRHARRRSSAPGITAAPTAVKEAWEALRPLSLNPAVLERNRVITARRRDPAFGVFDVLRTKVMQALSERGWRRVGITSPTKGCGKSFLSVNLALTLSRYDNCRTILLDMDMRRPAVASTLGIRDPDSIGAFLRGQTPPQDFLRRVGPNPFQIGNSLALGLNGKREPFASELLCSATTADVLARMETLLKPEIVVLDLPPIFAQDDVLALQPHLDCILLVAGGGLTTARDLREAARRIGPELPVLGVVLNKAEGKGLMDYSY